MKKQTKRHRSYSASIGSVLLCLFVAAVGGGLVALSAYFFNWNWTRFTAPMWAVFPVAGMLVGLFLFVIGIGAAMGIIKDDW